jgi:hypothetical protein
VGLAVLELPLLSLELLPFMLAVAVVVQVQLVVQAVLGVVVLVVLVVLLVVLRELLTQVEVVEVAVMEEVLEPQAVQALLFFATPAQFNISLVAQ